MRKFFVTLVLFVGIGIKVFADNIPYAFNNMFSISVSDKLELRKHSDAYTHLLRDSIKYVSNAPIVFQQNNLSICTEEAYRHYCRIMFQTYTDETCSLPYSDEFTLSRSEIQELEDACKGELAPGQGFVIPPTSTIETTDNGHKYLRINYIRSGYNGNGNVNVDICYFLNRNQLVKGIFSYRVSESAIWETSLKDAMNSFSWNEPYVLNKEDEAPVGFSGVVFVGVILLLLLCMYVVTQAKKQKAEKQVIEAELKRAESLLSEKRLVSAQKVLSSVKVKIGDKHTEYKSSVDEKEQRIQRATDDVNRDITSMLQNVREDFVHSDKTQVKDRRAELYLENEEIPSSAKQKLSVGLTNIENEYLRGIAPDQKEAFTKYILPKCNQVDAYCYYTAPAKGTIVFPYRRRKVELRGYSERGFELKLKKALAKYRNYQVLGDVSILPANDYHPYEPDISIVELNNKYGIRVDIEIDEPYSGLDRTPIHYVGCGDEFRDKNLANLGWIVIRFSEKQVFQEPTQCINYVLHVLSLIDDGIVNESDDFPKKDKRWTETEAKTMALKNYRENILGHRFGKREKDDGPVSTTQTEQEKKAATKVKPLHLPTSRPRNIDNSSTSFLQDNQISFDPKEHIYLYNGVRKLTPVSDIVNRFFEPFDSIGKSEDIALRTGRDQCEILEEWDCKGAESREIGTFLHAQIESYFAGEPMVRATRFVYDGEYVNVNKTVSIKDELQYFNNFLAENPINPFRTEWRIFDLGLGIAGTIDLLCKNGNTYEIYDWKRSSKASPDERIWNYGINGLEHIPDISYYHYALQQNLYKYILEKNYGIKVSNMYIVVFHPQYGNYRKHRIPLMKKEIETVIRKIQ